MPNIDERLLRSEPQDSDDYVKIMPYPPMVGLLPPSAESHWCSASYTKSKPCDHESQYYNRLSCSCFAKNQCEKGCVRGTAMSPAVTCGGCETEEEISKLYPYWATPEDIQEARNHGMELNEQRPEKW